MNSISMFETLGNLMDPISLLIAVGCVFGLAAVTRKGLVIVIVGSVLLTLARETLTYKEVGVVWGDKLLFNAFVAFTQIVVTTLIVMRIKKRKAKEQTTNG